MSDIVEQLLYNIQNIFNNNNDKEIIDREPSNEEINLYLKKLIEITKVYSVYDNELEPELFNILCNIIEKNLMLFDDINNENIDNIQPKTIILIAEYL